MRKKKKSFHIFSYEEENLRLKKIFLLTKYGNPDYPIKKNFFFLLIQFINQFLIPEFSESQYGENKEKSTIVVYLQYKSLLKSPFTSYLIKEKLLFYSR